MVKLPLAELLADGDCSWVGEGWRRVQHQALGQPAFMADRKGFSATVNCRPGVTGIWLLRHGWSGAAQITHGGKTERVSLRSEVQDLQFVHPIDAPGDEPTSIQVTVDCDEGTPVSHSQVWILGLAYDRRPLPKVKTHLLSETARLIDGDWGRFLVLPQDADIPTGILNEGAWSPNDVAVFKKHVNPGDCVLDIGSHVGHHSIVFSKLVGPSGMVLAVEAQRVMFQLLNANCVINGAANVCAVHLAASDRSGKLSMYPVSSVGNNLGSLGVNLKADCDRSQGRGEVVDAGCVDDLVERYCHDRRVAFVKLDVQSHEKYVLRGLLRTITRDRPKLFFEIAPYWMHRTGYDYHEVYDMLRTLKYRFEHSRAPPTIVEGVPETAVTDRIEWDTLALPG